MKEELIKIFENNPYDEVEVILKRKENIHGEKWGDEAWNLYNEWSVGNLEN